MLEEKKAPLPSCAIIASEGIFRQKMKQFPTVLYPTRLKYVRQSAFSPATNILCIMMETSYRIYRKIWKPP